MFKSYDQSRHSFDEGNFVFNIQELYIYEAEAPPLLAAQ